MIPKEEITERLRQNIETLSRLIRQHVGRSADEAAQTLEGFVVALRSIQPPLDSTPKLQRLRRYIRRYERIRRSR